MTMIDGCFLIALALVAVSAVMLFRSGWRDLRAYQALLAASLAAPQPRRRRVVLRSTTVLLCLVALEIGFFAGSIGAGFFLTAP